MNRQGDGNAEGEGGEKRRRKQMPVLYRILYGLNFGAEQNAEKGIQKPDQSQNIPGIFLQGEQNPPPPTPLHPPSQIRFRPYTQTGKCFSGRSAGTINCAMMALPIPVWGCLGR